MNSIAYNVSQLTSMLGIIGIILAIFGFIPAAIIDIIQRRFFWLKRVLILGVGLAVLAFIIPLILVAIGR